MASGTNVFSDGLVENSASFGEIDSDCGQAFDYARRLIWLAPRGNGVAAPEPLTAFDRAGLFLVARREGGVQHVFVQRVIAGSPAAEAGLAEGDEVTSLDGRPVPGMRLSVLRATFRSRATISARLGVKRGGALSVRVLTLRDLV